MRLIDEAQSDLERNCCKKININKNVGRMDDNCHANSSSKCFLIWGATYG